jgi:hypothetical protein
MAGPTSGLRSQPSDPEESDAPFAIAAERESRLEKISQSESKSGQEEIMEVMPDHEIGTPEEHKAVREELLKN